MNEDDEKIQKEGQGITPVPAGHQAHMKALFLQALLLRALSGLMSVSILRTLLTLRKGRLPVCHKLRCGGAVGLVQVAVQQVQDPDGHKQSQSLHKPQGLPQLIIGKAGSQIAEAPEKAQKPVAADLPDDVIKGQGHDDIADDVKGHEPADMVPHDGHLQVGGQPVHGPEPGGGADGENKLRKALLPVAGPHIKVIHIEALDHDVPVHIKCKHGKQQDPEQICSDPQFFILPHSVPSLFLPD